MNPSFQNLFHSTQFIIATACTLLLTSTSMIVNDIYDIQHDKIDHPTRPLPSGIISLPEAGITVILFLGVIEYFSTTYLRADLHWLIHLSTAIVLMYTPILKRIPFVKNISCASLVALSLFFTGLSTTTTEMSLQTHFPLLCISMSSVFFGSLYNEIILDMRDIEGDRVNRIYTLPVIMGLPASYVFLFFIAYLNLEWNFLSMYYLFGILKALGYLLCYSPLLLQINNIHKQNYSKESLIQASKASNIPLLLVMLYLCILTVF
jgi:geranylgeranylglycerol-phosphate geranylgeranyltransferase